MFMICRPSLRLGAPHISQTKNSAKQTEHPTPNTEVRRAPIEFETRRISPVGMNRHEQVEIQVLMEPRDLRNLRAITISMPMTSEMDA